MDIKLGLFELTRIQIENACYEHSPDGFVGFSFHEDGSVIGTALVEPTEEQINLAKTWIGNLPIVPSQELNAAKFNTERLLGVLNTLLSQSEQMKLAAQTANLIGYCNYKNFWGEKSASSYLSLMLSSGIATQEEINTIKQAFQEQGITLDV